MKPLHYFKNFTCFLFQETKSGILPFILCMLQPGTASACNPHADFRYSANGQNVTFTNLSTGANKYVWYFGDGNSSGQVSPSHTYALANSYHVHLMAYDTTTGGCFDTAMQIVFSGGCNLEAKFRFSINGSEVSFFNESVNYGANASAYFWSFGDGSSSLQSQPVHTYTGQGPYTITYIFEDTSITNCRDTLVHSLRLNECNFNADFTYTLIGTKTVKFTNTSTNCNSYNIDFDSNGEYVYTYPYPGTFWFALIGKNSWCTDPGDSAIENILIPGCFVNASYYISRDTNSNFSGIIYNNSVAGRSSQTTYLWKFGDGDSSTDHTPTHTYPGQGRYQLCLTLKDSTCSSTFCDSIGFNSNGQMQATIPFSIKVIDITLGLEKSLSGQEQHCLIYPNPGTGNVYLQMEKGFIEQIHLFDLKGRMLFNEKYNTDSAILDLSHFGSGIFILQLSDDLGHTTVYKLIRSE